MPVFKNVACGLVDDCPDEVFGGVGRDGLGLSELLGGKCVPLYGWFLVGGVGIWGSVMMQLMMCAAQPLS